MSQGGKKGRGIMAVIRQDTTSPVNAPELPKSPAVSEILLKLDERIREVEKLKKGIAELENKLDEAERKILKPGGPLGDEPDTPDDKAMAIEALRAKAAEFDMKGNLLDAFYLYRRIIRIDPCDLPSLYQMATIYYSANLKAKAALVLELIVEIDPTQERAKESLGEIRREMRG